MSMFFEREVRELCKDLEWEEVVLVLLGVLDGVNSKLYDDFKMCIEVYKDDKKKREVKEEFCDNTIINKNYWKGFNNGIRTEKFRESKRQEFCENAIIEWKKDFKEYVNLLAMSRDDYNGIMEYIDELPITYSVKQTNSVLEDIKEEINQIRILHNSSSIGYGLDIALGIIDKHINKKEDKE